jgi:YegS/Rv2252/BmrU family lipid kinase
VRTCLIINPVAGRKAGLTTNALGVDDVQALLARHEIEAEVFCTEHEGHATDLARKAVAGGYTRVIAAGGDGTVAEVAEGLVGADACLGVLPLGSVMNVARMLAIPRDLDAAAEVIDAGQLARIDIGRASTRVRQTVFLEAAGIGIDAGLFAYVNEIDRGNWRSMRPLLKFMWRYRSRRLTLRLDGEAHRYRAMMLTVANGPYVGAALTMAPDALLDDGQFDIEVFTRFGKVELFRHLLSIIGGRRAYNPKVLTRRASVVEVAPDRPMMVHADSKPLGTTPARFEILPQALTVLVGAGEPNCRPALSKQPGTARDLVPERAATTLSS